ncbi:phage tail tape measure protein [Lactococcus lactis]|uniref:phage tail tape measure protein n=1 Tax=Lactococcus lactis TaxID=1358 RepID=UPI002890448F|nr:phage tail tape measure protein [Lactococcus lactis]MDT2877194.1 phage tail tape measure protein [Lactococcus lactis]
MADTPLGKMIIEMGFDDSSFAKGVTGVNKQLSALKNDLKTSQTSFSTFGKGVDGVKSPMEVLTKSIETQKRQLELLKKSYDGSLVDGKASSSTQKYAADISRASAQMAQFKAQLKLAAEEQYKQTSLLPKLSTGFQKVSGGLNSIASVSTPASIAITATFAKGIQAATNFNGKMTEIQALLSDGTPANVLSKQMDTLSDKSKQWARQYGIDTSSINDGMEEMIKRGYDFNQTVGAMPAVLDASRASGEDFGTVMSASTAILEQFGLKTEDTASMMKNTQRVTDSLTFVANKTSAGFEDMGIAMEYVGPVAHSLGMNVEQTAAAVGLLSNNGIEGEKAGTSLRGALSRLLKPTKQSSAAFEELGINIDEWKKGNIGLPDMLDTIKKHTEGMTDAEKSSLVAKAFGVEAQTGMNVLINQGGDALRNLTKETQNATGYTKKLADQMNNSDKNAFNKAKATLEVLSIDLGQKLLPSIIPVVKEIDNLAGSFSKLSPETQQFIIKMAIAAAAVAPTAKALSGLTSILSGVTGGLAKLGAKGAGELALKGIATGATGAATEVGGLSAVLAGMGPASMIAIGALGAAGLGLVIWKLTEGLREQQKEVSKWGTVVGTEASGKLDTLNQKFVAVKDAAIQFDVQGSPAIGNVKQAISDLGTVASESITETEKALTKGAETAGLTNKQVNDAKAGLEQQKANVQSITDQTTAIYQNAANAHRGITDAERSIVESNQQKLIETTIKNYGITGNKAKEVMKVFSGDLKSMNDDALKQSSAGISKMMQEEIKTYKTGQASLDSAKASGALKADEYNKKTQALEKSHNDTMEKYGEEYVKVKAEQQQREIDNLQGGAHKIERQRAIIQKNQQQLKDDFKKFGLDYDQVMSNVGKSGDKGSKAFGDTGNLIAQYTTKMSADAKKANDSWNGIILDPKTGKMTTDAPKAIAEALNAKGGWDNMQFILKNANLSTNARIKIAEALIANGQWNQMTPEQKQLVVNNNPALQAITSGKGSMASWNSMPENVKKLLGNDTDFQNKKGAAASALKAWDAMPENVKKMLADNFDVLAKKEGATNAILQWNNLPADAKKLLASNQTASGVNSANSWIQNNFLGKTVDLNANDSGARKTLSGFLGDIPTSKTIDLIINKTNNAQGTPYHPGGLAMVNDQKGPTYKELISLPNGVSFIPEGRDVTMPLPKGTKILKASKTAQLIPKYADGTGGIPADAKIFRDMRAVQQQLVVSAPVVDNSGQLNAILKVLEKIASSGTNKDVINALQLLGNRPVDAYLDLDKVTKKITDKQNRENRIKSLMKGGNI